MTPAPRLLLCKANIDLHLLLVHQILFQQIRGRESTSWVWARLYEVRTSPLSLKLSLCDLCGLKGSLQSVCHDCHLKEDPTPNLHVPGSNIQAQLGVLHAVTAQPCLPLHVLPASWSCSRCLLLLNISIRQIRASSAPLADSCSWKRFREALGSTQETILPPARLSRSRRAARCPVGQCGLVLNTGLCLPTCLQLLSQRLLIFVNLSFFTLS